MRHELNLLSVIREMNIRGLNLHGRKLLLHVEGSYLSRNFDQCIHLFWLTAFSA